MMAGIFTIFATVVPFLLTLYSSSNDAVAIYGQMANDSAIYSPDMLVSAPACTRCTMDHATRVVLWPNPLDSHRHQREGGFHPLLQVSPGR